MDFLHTLTAVLWACIIRSFVEQYGGERRRGSSVWRGLSEVVWSAADAVRQPHVHPAHHVYYASKAIDRAPWHPPLAGKMRAGGRTGGVRKRVGGVSAR
ncbi:hypothetical protein B0G73_13279 [Paraburkholderia sp. BL25I1N1]|nr:hypothetical protein B0G73_13279 [Paraburkholderia sp. BL25I1N1]